MCTCDGLGTRFGNPELIVPNADLSIEEVRSLHSQLGQVVGMGGCCVLLGRI